MPSIKRILDMVRFEILQSEKCTPSMNIVINVISSFVFI